MIYRNSLALFGPVEGRNLSNYRAGAPLGEKYNANEDREEPERSRERPPASLRGAAGALRA